MTTDRNGSAVSLRWLFGRTREVLVHEGVASTILRTLAYVGYKSGVWLAGWYERSLDSPVAAMEPPDGIELVELTGAGEAAYLRLHDTISAAEYRRRLARGERCFAARDRRDGELASVSWSARHSVYIDFIGRELTLGPTLVYLYDSYTRPAWRGRRLQAVLGAHCLASFARAGCRRAALIIAPENRANIRSRHRMGFRRSSYLVRIHTGRIRRDFRLGRVIESG